MIEPGRDGLLADFFDVDGMAEAANRVLDASQDYRHLGRAGVEKVLSHYSMDVCVPQMRELYEDVAAR